jgi:O-antigen ligase
MGLHSYALKVPETEIVTESDGRGQTGAQQTAAPHSVAVGLQTSNKHLSKFPARILAACIAFSTVPLTMSFGRTGGHKPLHEILFELAAMLLIVRQLPNVKRAFREANWKHHFRQPLMIATAVLILAVLIAIIAHPTGKGALTLLRIVGACAVAIETRQFFGGHRATAIVRSICGVVFLEFVVSAAQLLRNGPVGGVWFAESESGFRRINGVMGPSGTIGFANTLSILCTMMTTVLLVTLVRHPLSRIDRRLAHVAAVMATAIAGVSLCRTALIAHVVLLGVAFVARERRRIFPLLVVLTITLAASMAIRHDGWIERGKSSVAGSEAAGSGRMALNRQAWAIFKLEPVTGVGFGNYYTTIHSHPEIDSLSREDILVHNVVLYALACAGVIGAAAFALFSLALARKAAGNGIWSLGVLLVAAPILLLCTQMFTGIGPMWFGLFAGIALVRPALEQAKP